VNDEAKDFRNFGNKGMFSHAPESNRSLEPCKG
jgi:hypothetical protein